MSVKERTYAGVTLNARREERRIRFLDAGLAVFGDHGYRDTSVSAICTAANLARAHFYEQFGDREELLLAVYDRIQEQSRVAVIEALANHQSDDIAARTRAGLQAYARSIGEDPRRAAVSFVEIVGVSAAVEKHRLDQRDQWRSFIRVEMTRYLGDDYEPPGGWAVATTALIGALMALVEQWATTKRARQRRLEDLTEVLTRFTLSLF
ncbi:TetR/AcrR family transcriptional regulator [Gordonia soli]|uniref:Putative TetR family transcriptional regulator n=1 Tax=Gordonia soli NBRC 108243 TaxID=1223545 RepID=M0QLE7_9ACTN|nr:TetR/AcrR family transcriptional regulator [Gordonia soli]GAC68232.1 putative TetR family transcriptional regulator [Gordonia soli NBRC 108243]